MKKLLSKFLVIAFIMLCGISIVSASSYTFGSITNLTSGRTKRAVGTKNMSEHYYTVSVVRDAITTNSASFTAYVIRPTSTTGTSGTTLFSAPMNLNTTMTSYNASYNGYVESGNKGMKFTGNSGNVSFTPTLIGR